MRRYLETKEGCRFYPKTRQFLVPIPNSKSSLFFINPDHQQIFDSRITRLIAYLQGQAIFDRFNIQDYKRRIWREAMTNLYDQVFLNAYRIPNQLPVGHLGDVRFAFQHLQTIAEQNGELTLAAFLEGQDTILRQKCRGYALKSDNDKLIVVRAAEDLILETLEYIYRNSDKELMLVT